MLVLFYSETLKIHVGFLLMRLIRSCHGFMFNTRDVKRYEPPCEKTGLRGFQQGPTQIGLYSHRRWIEA